ncbi:MAG TPA: hypothetical protein VF062_00365 [Candidatus Limnocylindrales bacterium]
MTILRLSLIATLLLAACGSEEQPSAERDAEIRAVTAEMTECIRRNGVPELPDPTFNDEGHPQAGPEWDPATNPKVAEAVQGPCKQIMERMEALAQAPEQARPPLSAEDQAKLREYAKCMREHGLPDFPDADNTGRFKLPDSWPDGLGKGDRPMDRVFLDAMKACEPLAVPGMAMG